MATKRKKTRPLHPSLTGLPTRLEDAMVRAGYDVRNKTDRGNRNKTGAQKAFADAAGVQDSTVSLILSGKVPPNISAGTLLRMAEALGESIGYLCGEIGPTGGHRAWARDRDGVITGEEPEENPAAPKPRARRGAR